MLWLIEPHADDVYLSLHQHIVTVWKEEPKTLVTVYCNERRRRESENYASAVGMQHVALNYAESGHITNKAGKIDSFPRWGLPLKSSDRIVFPLGLEHPEHRLVASFGPTVALGALYYLDTPCHAKLKLADELQKRMESRVLASIRAVSKRKWGYSHYYKSQAMYFYYNPPETLPKLELVMT